MAGGWCPEANRGEGGYCIARHNLTLCIHTECPKGESTVPDISPTGKEVKDE